MRALRIGSLILLIVLAGCVEVPPAATAYGSPLPATTPIRTSGQHVATTSTAVAYPGFAYPGYPYYAPYPLFRPYP